jgi:outer membrane protein OmpU
MKKFLIATTALVATAGFAQAEIAISGEAKAGLIYNSEGDEKSKVHSEVLMTLDGSGESDGGLQFGFNANIIIEDNGVVANDDTTVYMSGAYGKLSFGSVAEADEQAGLSDIGWEGLDVDDVAEALVGDEVGDLLVGGIKFSHNVNYTYATGPLSFSVSGRLKTSHKTDTYSIGLAGTPPVAITAADVESYAAGMKYNFGDAYVGLGYADHSVQSNIPTFGRSSVKVVSAFGGGTFGAIKVAALYSDATIKDGGGKKDGAQAYGLNASYTMDALTVSLGLGKADFDAGLGRADQQSIGIGASYNLGGGAFVQGGIAQVESDDDENQGFGKAKETRADLGVTFKF